MAEKPAWMAKLEEKQANNSLVTNQAIELSASHRRILKEDAPKIWGRVADCLRNTLATCQIQGIVPVIDRPTTNSITIQIFRNGAKLPEVDMIVQFLLMDYEIKSGFRVPSPHKPRAFRFTVSEGRVSLSEGATPLPDEGEDIAQIVCQRLLEPVLASFI